MPKKSPSPTVRHPTELTRQERVGVLMDMLDERRKGGSRPVTVPAWMARLKAETHGKLPCAKTLHRDATDLAKTLRDQNGGKQVLAFDSKSQSWSLAFPVSRSEIALPTCLSLVRGDDSVTTLFLARRAAEQFSHTPLFAPMQAMLDQMVGGLPAPQRRRLEKLAGQIHFTGPAFYPLAPETFEPILAGLDHGRQVKIGYRNLQGVESERVISPLGLVVVDRAWHVVAVDSQSGEVRDFRLSRIWEAQVTQESFAAPKGFELKGYLAEGFGGLGQADRKPQEVVLRFTKGGAAIALSDVLWHPTQKAKTQPDGSVELRFKTTALFHVRNQVMAYAGFVEVVEPKELRDGVLGRAEALVKMHE